MGGEENIFYAVLKFKCSPGLATFNVRTINHIGQQTAPGGIFESFKLEIYCVCKAVYKILLLWSLFLPQTQPHSLTLQF